MREVNDGLSLLTKQVAQLGELGLMGVAIAEENGGTGLDYLVRQHIRERERLQGFACREPIAVTTELRNHVTVITPSLGGAVIGK